jgi:putative transcriptional regulator
MSKAGESILRGAREALAYARGQDDGFVAHVPKQVDVRAVRQRTGLSQAKFAAEFGFALDALRNWEQGRRQPDVCARAFLVVIDREPEAVRRALTIPEYRGVPKSGRPQRAGATADPVRRSSA